jgi:hypothetical protein
MFAEFRFLEKVTSRIKNRIIVLYDRFVMCWDANDWYVWNQNKSKVTTDKSSSSRCLL